MRLERKLARAIAEWWELAKAERVYVGDDLEDLVEVTEEEEREVSDKCAVEGCDKPAREGAISCSVAHRKKLLRQQGRACELERAEVGALN